MQTSEAAVCLSCYKGNNMVMNHLLTFVSSYRSRSSTLQMKTVLLNYYSHDEINEARQVMIDNTKDIIPDFPHLSKKRTDSVNRQANDIMFDDISDMFKALDSADQQSVPTFVCDDVTRLPAAPEASGNMMTIYDELAAHQRQLLELQEKMSRMIQDVSKNHSDIAVLRTRQDNSTREVKGKQNMRATATRESATVQADAGEPEIQTIDEQTLTPNGAEPAPGGSGEQNRRLYAGAAAAPSVPGHKAEEEFHTVGKNSVKRPNKGTGNSQVKKKTPRTGGTAERSGLLAAGPETFQLQITNVSPSLNSDDIVRYVESKEEDTKPRQVEDTTSEGWNTRRFLLTFDFKYYDRVMAQDFWPQQIYYKRWFTRKQNNTIHGE